MMSLREATMVVKKRERTQNWVPEEKSALFSLIKHHVNAIENKKIDAAASASKIRAWQKIHSEFQTRFSTDRDITRMREQWRRMKTLARTEMYTFAEKLRLLGPEEAAKSRPSSLSMDVWRLTENIRKNDCDADRSDESSEDANGLSSGKGTLVSSAEFYNHDIKLERPDDDYENDTTIQEHISNQQDVDERDSENNKIEIDRETPSNLSKRKRPRFDDDQRENCINGDLTQDFIELNENEGSCQSKINLMDHKTSKQKTVWLFEATQKEFNLKLKILNIELEKAEFQKRTAFNELKTAEIKKQLAEKQAEEYYSQVRMSGEPGSGAGRGGGGGGSIRAAGGSFGKMEAAHEDQYFYNQQKEQLRKLRAGLHDEISFHEEQIKRHQEAISRHHKRIEDIEKESV